LLPIALAKYCKTFEPIQHQQTPLDAGTPLDARAKDGS